MLVLFHYSGEQHLNLLGAINYMAQRKKIHYFKTVARNPSIHTKESVLIFDSSSEANFTEKYNLILKNIGIRPLFVFLHNEEERNIYFREFSAIYIFSWP